MKKARTILAGAAAALAMAVTSAFAAPLGPSSTGPAASNDLVVQTQAMCRYPNGWAPCRPAYRRPPPPPPAYYAPPPRYYPPVSPRTRRAGSDFCAMTYNRCNDAYGRGSPAYYACMRQARC